MQNSRKNKQNMCRSIKNLLTANGEKKSLIYVNPDMIRKCITDKCLKDISSRYNHAYQVLIGDKLINIVFLEVKARKNFFCGRPSEFVDLKKQAKIKKTALDFIVKKNIVDKNFRFDVIEVLNKKVWHIINAFDF